MNILFISGHGAGDPGAVGCGRQEADETRRVTAALRPILSEYASVTVYPTERNAFSDYKNGTLASTAQFQRYDYVLEVHFNAVSASTSDGKTKGVEIYVPTTETDLSMERSMANKIAAVGLTNRGVKTHNWSVISQARQSGAHAALLEVCFLDDPDDMRVYQEKFEEIVSAISDAIVQGFHLEKEGPAVTYETFKAYMSQYLTELAAKNPSDWSAGSREWAEKNGIIQGDGNGNMRYKSNVTREELVTMLQRLLAQIK